jgi:hypothetical protein
MEHFAKSSVSSLVISAMRNKESMSHTNILIALSNLIENPITDLISHYKSANRANNLGDALETYVKDLFCNSIALKNDDLHGNYFSYLGNQNNPPDAMIRNGDAIEIKKIESLNSAIALNSSPPKNRLYVDDSRITQACRDCEQWTQKDILYVIGVAPKNEQRVKVLWFVYGDCYAADKQIYQRIADKISVGIQEIPDVEFIETNELAKVKKVDPLGITDLRVRGMWHIANPINVFKDIAPVNFAQQLTVQTLMLEEKYNTFPEQDRAKLEQLQSDFFRISDVQIKSPNNPAQKLAAKLLSYAK